MISLLWELFQQQSLRSLPQVKNINTFEQLRITKPFLKKNQLKHPYVQQI